MVTSTTALAELPPDDPRLSRALFTLRESATYLNIPASTMHRWARPRGLAPLVTVLPRAGRTATVPFVGFAEASC